MPRMMLHEAAMEITVRNVPLQDAEGIAHSIREIGWFEHLKSESAQRTLKRVRQYISFCLADDRHTAFIAEDETHQVIGYSSLHELPYFFLAGPERFVSDFFIHSGSRAKCGHRVVGRGHL